MKNIYKSVELNNHTTHIRHHQYIIIWLTSNSYALQGAGPVEAAEKLPHAHI